ncbi:MAG: DNA mismatch repair endonuclease MutL [Nitrospira sp. SB0662_bin_26]|nr:DNA mismatch repair endonuclease MutL [Nitrospira sp. SB0662_bin_26]
MESVESRIKVLPESVASQIAAGEIVERPASVVKELLDNSVDAGSTVVSVDVVDGGRTLIRVIDDGEGMSRADAPLACQRFATSKISHPRDLTGIATYGFRGEALPSIAAVSRFRMLTARHHSLTGTAVVIDETGAQSVEERGAAPGTRIEVEELFFNTPGRRKFLKTTSTEFSHVAHVVQQAALVNLHTQFRLTHNDHVVFDYPKVTTLEDRLLQVYGPRLMGMMLPVHYEQADVRVRGAIVNPYHAKTGRTPQEIFVNRRPVKNSTISHAVYESYGSFLPKGRHPTFALMVEVAPNEVDVNVHPSKREVKFCSPDLIHRAIKAAVRGPLQKDVTGRSTLSSGRDEREAGVVEKETAGESGERFVTRSASFMACDVPSSSGNGQNHEAAQVKESPVLYQLEPEVRIFGQIHATYIVAQIEDELHVLDQHTIHERVLFERLWRGWEGGDIQTQALLIPEPVDVPVTAATRLTEILPELVNVGLELESFGPSSFVIRSVPALVGQMDYGALLEDIIEDLSEWNSVDSLDKPIRSVLASMACQGAVQAGRRMEQPEMKHVVDEWLREGSPMTCPHGRRISLRFGSEELHRIFRRL